MHPDHIQQHPTQADRAAVRRVLATVGVSGAALVLSAAAAAPAFAVAAGDGGGHGPDAHAQHGQSTAASHRSGTDQAGSDQTGSDRTGTDQAGTDQTGSGADRPASDHGTATAAEHRDSHAGGQQAGGSAEHAHTAGGPAGDTATTGHNPPGNNGTVKIHDLYGDTAHHNVPHVDCDFAVDFWGFDLQQGLSVSFAGQAPTGKDVAIPVSAPTTITSTTDAGGGNDYDGELQFPAGSLDLSGLGAPHPQQGYHVKLTVATGQGGGYKYKVFWLQPCATAPTTATTGSTTGGGTTPTTPEVGGTETETGTTGSLPAGGTTEAAATTTRTGQPAEVLGERFVRRPTAVSPTAAGPQASTLPFTGGEIAGLAAAGAAALGGGAALTVAGRRRRRAGVTA